MEKEEIKKVIEDLFFVYGEKNVKKKNINFLYRVIKSIFKNVKNIKNKTELFQVVEKSNKKVYLILLDFEKKKKDFKKY